MAGPGISRSLMSQPSLPALDASLRQEMSRRFARRKVTNASDYDVLLADFLPRYETKTHREFTETADLGDRHVLLLRHDIDHDFETALRMARWEHERGLRATYCVLHSAWYYGKLHVGRHQHTRDMLELCHTLQDLGHEVNLHNNAVTLALEHGVDPCSLLDAEISFLRSRGINITGTCTHGDRLCRELNYGNFEIFAEAVKAERGGVRTVRSTAGHAVRLGQLRYSDLGLSYEAYDIARDIYISDSGGRLRCSRNAAGRRPFGRHDPEHSSVVGILTHPIWWDFSSA